MTVMSIDPGAVHCGIALWRNRALRAAYERTPELLIDLVSDMPLECVVIESFSLSSPKYDRGKSKEAVATLELIGMVRGIAGDRGVPVYKQFPSLRHIAMRGREWRNLKLDERWGPKLRNDHVASAVAHGLYFFHFGKGVG